MIEKTSVKFTPIVTTFRVILFTFLIIYSLIFISRTLLLVATIPSLKVGASHTSFWVWMRNLVLELSGPIYFFVAFCLFKLIQLISRNEPFGSASSRYVRRIAFAVFVLFSANMIDSAIREFTSSYGHVSEVIIRFLFPGGLITLLVGFGFLVIARVLEVGEKLQQDQNLTI